MFKMVLTLSVGRFCLFVVIYTLFSIQNCLCSTENQKPSFLTTTTSAVSLNNGRALNSQQSTSTSTKAPKELPEAGPELIAYCLDPGRPTKSQLSPLQSRYTDGESVTYTCDEYISLKQHRKCVKGKWHGDTPICGAAFRDNDLILARYYDRDSRQLVSEYNLTGKLKTWPKFGNSFIAERFDEPLRGSNASRYYMEFTIAKPAMLQMVRLSFSLVNHLTDARVMGANFNVETVHVSPYRDCQQVSYNSVSPWHFNSTRFDYWFFCRSKSNVDFSRELKNMSRLLKIETSGETPVEIDLATFILAEQYSNNENRSDPICGLPEVPVGLESRVVNDQTNYVFTCATNFKRVDNFGGQFHLRTCGHDQRWHGDLPECYPVKTCTKFSSARSHLVEVFKYDRIYYTKNEGEWLAIPGSRAFFRCKDETHIFVGKETRVCDEDGEWSNSMPNCLVSAASDAGIRSTTILIIVLVTLLFTFVLSFCTIYFFFKMRTQKAPTQLEMGDAAAYYASSMDSGKMLPEDNNYEVLEPFEARYATAYNPAPHMTFGDPILVKTSPFDSHPKSYIEIQDADSYPNYPPVPAPRSRINQKPQESEYYDDTVADQSEQKPYSLYDDSH